MHVPARDGNDVFDDGELMDVQTRGQVDGRGHGTVPVQTEQVFLQRDGRGALGVELARDGGVLDGDGFGVGADDGVDGFVGGGFGAADGGFLEGDAGQLVGCVSARRRGRACLPVDVLVGGFFLLRLHGSETGASGAVGGGCGGDVAGDLD